MTTINQSEQSIDARDVENNVEHKDEKTVDWAEDDENADLYPQNWSKKKKWLTLWLVVLITLSMNLGSSPISPSAKDILKELGYTNSELQAFLISIFVLGFAFGPMIWAPLSDVYGRNPIYFICLLFYIIFSCICAVSKHLSTLIIFRFLTGFSASQTAGGTIGDMFGKENESLAMACYSLAPIAANGLSPVIGGYIAQLHGWRWVFWVNAIIAAPILIISPFILPETNHDIILQRIAKKAGKKVPEKKNQSFDLSNLTSAFQKLFTNTIVFLCGLYLAFVYGVVYIFLTSMGLLFRNTYGFSTGQVGLAYLGMVVGMLIGSFSTGILGNRAIKKAYASKGKVHAEIRLIPACYMGIFVPIGLFWYGWSAQEGVHWICPIIATSLLGIGLADAFVCIQTYIIDAYPKKEAAEGLAATTFLRSIFGCLLPIGGEPLYSNLQFSWGNSLLGFIALLLVPIPWLFLKKGREIRHNNGIDVDINIPGFDSRDKDHETS